MSKVEEKLAKSLTAESTELIPYLPYLLQDLWELGSSPKDIIDMTQKHIQISKEMKVLDLTCGKEKWFLFFQNAGVKLLDERFIEDDELESLNDEQQSFIEKRANELKEKYPDKESLFESYIKSQQAECDELENEISGVMMLLQVL
ncbi:MAG: hypothetical protein BWY74_00853 [Firmicutes bacterium ADurb.Bin419]|nr:MAG: hypothetical protein BWY74_00853 [Firmicutes bacterium ADurb.Bin419]